MIGGLVLLSFFPLQPPSSVLSGVEHQMTGKDVLLGCIGLQGKVAWSVSCTQFIWL